MKSKKRERTQRRLSDSGLRKLAWKTFSDYIRERDNWTCFTCGRKGEGKNIHAGHFYPKKIGGVLLRFSPINCFAQCYACNRHYDGFGILYSINYRKRFGPEADVALLAGVEKSKATVPTRAFYEDVIQKYGKELRKIRGEL